MVLLITGHNVQIVLICNNNVLLCNIEMKNAIYIQGFFYSCPNCLEMLVYYISMNVKIMYCLVANIHEWLENVVLYCLDAHESITGGYRYFARKQNVCT